jgi:adenylate cyclase
MPRGSPGNEGNTSQYGVPPGGVRRQAAIMFTDIKDFARRAQTDELQALRMLEEHNRIMARAVAGHGGVVVKTLGDAFLVTFDDAVGAAKCGVAVQQEFHDYNAMREPGDQIIVRIGIHYGDVIVKDNDVFGDGVNVASRIQSIAEPGGINITEGVRQVLPADWPLRVLDLGVPQLKNISKPVRVYQIVVIPSGRPRGPLYTRFYVLRTFLARRRSKQVLTFFALLLIAAAAVVIVSSRAPVVSSLAILPFEYLGPSAQEYVADALTEELISEASRVQSLLVISRGSAFQFKGSALDDQAIGNELGVRYLLRGSVRRADDGGLVVVASLHDDRTAKRVWTEEYSLRPTEYTRLQSEIPRLIVGRMVLQLPGTARQTLPDVYDAYARGLYEAKRLTREGNVAALSYFHESLAKDEHFIPARVALAKTQLLNVDWGWDRSAAWLDSAEQNATRVMARDSSVAEALAILGKVKIGKGDRERGMDLLQRALRFDSRNSTALTALAREHMFTLNDPAAGISYYQRARETDPTNFVLASNIGIGYGMLKNYPAAIEAFRRAAALNKNHFFPLQKLAIAFERAGRMDSALFYYRMAAQRDPLQEETHLYWGELLVSLGRSVEATEVLDAFKGGGQPSYRILYLKGVASSEAGQPGSARVCWNDGLTSARTALKDDPSCLECRWYTALLLARLGRSADAIAAVTETLHRDSSDSDVLFNVARVYAVLGRREAMLSFFKQARSRNAEFDTDFLATAIDFKRYRGDPALLSLAH